MNNHSLPLCVDCDGTLLRTDLLHEAVFMLAKQYPPGLFLLPFWLLKGKAYVKEKLTQHVVFDWSTLPLNQDVIAQIKIAREKGRKIVLATASPMLWAEGIAKHVGLFDEVMATQEYLNLSGANKAKQLVSRFGERGFDYVGNSSTDLKVWRHAHTAIVASSNRSLIRNAMNASEALDVIPVKRAGLLSYIKALRVHQWLKNVLVFIPMLAAYKLDAPEALIASSLAFIAFSLCASSVYVLNDLLDLESDRQHVRKCRRPFAAATIPLWQGVLMVPVLLAVALAIALMLPQDFLIVLVVYYAMTMAYSFRLKRQVIVDVMMLAGLYTMRIIAGAAAANVIPSFWLLAFSMFIFLDLAMIKRYSELLVTLQQSKETAAGRGYTVNDLPVLMSLGASAGLGSVLIFSLYLHSPDVSEHYESVFWLWLLPPILLYWVSRLWMKAHRGEVDDDPVVFAVRDWQSLVVLALSAGCILAAIFL